jgi:hypothetical protein
VTDQREVTLDAATEADAELLSNLLELYIHDLSGVFPSVELGANGRFGYAWRVYSFDSARPRQIGPL